MAIKTKPKIKYCEEELLNSSESKCSFFNHKDTEHIYEESKALLFDFLNNNSIDDRSEQCPKCDIFIDFEDNVLSKKCPTCGTPLLLALERRGRFCQPDKIISFCFDKETCMEHIDKWIKRQKLTSKKFCRFVSNPDNIKPIYIPFWSYNTQNITSYYGYRGEDLNSIYAKWSQHSSYISKQFNNFLMPATKSFPLELLIKSKSWNLDEAIIYNDNLLNGCSAELYTLDFEQAFRKAKNIMLEEIEKEICKDMGGDAQTILYSRTSWVDISFSQLLLPLWFCTYKRKNKTFHLIVNGQNGDIIENSPKDRVKLSILILFIFAFVCGCMDLLFFL